MLFNRSEMLLPKDAQMSKWSVVACDQYTSEPDYWERVKDFTANETSSYNLILPEVYLEESDVDSRIEKINTKMKELRKRQRRLICSVILAKGFLQVQE